MRKGLKLLLLIAWLSLIFYLSNQPAAVSSEVSDFWSDRIAKILSILFFWTDTTGLTVFLTEHVEYIRKSAHVFEFLVLGVLSSMNSVEYFRKRTYLLSLAFCIFYALSDEVHQLFIQGRAGKAGDVLIDSIGAFIGIFLYHRIMKNEKETECSIDFTDRLSE